MKVTAHKDQSGELHENELDCLKADFLFEVRGALHQNLPGGGKSMNITTTEVAHCITANPDKFSDVIRKYQQKLRGFAARKPENKG